MERARRAANYCPPDEGELTNNIQIDFSAIPKHVSDDLAATVLDCVKDFLRQPGGKEILDARIAAKRAALKGANT
ncbi:MAG: hypothetical protein K0R50_443 [Eubacterium sp.]|nr:hypothetical protein [Eubacterium sp.]